jgi:hypothetical protein
VADLTLYYCESCGVLSVKNFRDGSCPVCHVAMKVGRIDIFFDEPDHIERGKAEHTDETDD